MEHGGDRHGGTGHRRTGIAAAGNGRWADTGVDAGNEAPEEALVEKIALREAIRALPEREQETIYLRFFKCMTQEQAARILGVSQVQVSRLERKGVTHLREMLRE